eukprot:TRINITY_DN32579_c0_g1_i1.p1 TRINITY_DN32579_c0_g1~~TRINITY_DN32579_c0_g1_i1.p1  ORF type:complete len:356 (-),score=78.02 TRINITY_DN32579_c0_g1_i1:211-1278(-)
MCIRDRMTWGGGHDTTMVEFFWASRPAPDAAGDVHVRVWDPALETFEVAPLDPAERERFTMGFHTFAFDDGTAPYDEQDEQVWAPLISKVDDDVLGRAGVPPGAHIMAGDTEAHPESHTLLPVVPHFDNVARTPQFTPIPPRRPADVTGWTAQRISQYMYDGSARLALLLEQYRAQGWQALLGELQLSFVLFLAVSSLEAWNWWKEAVGLLCSCCGALEDQGEGMSDFLDVLYEQLMHIPKDFFIDELSRDNFLEGALTSVAENIGMLPEGCHQLRQLTRGMGRVQQRLKKRFDYDLSLASSDMLEEGEDAPVVMDQECHLELQESTEQLPVVVEGSDSTERMSWMMPPSDLPTC